MILLCSVHGESKRKPSCPLAAEARWAYRAYRRKKSAEIKSGAVSGVMLTAVSVQDPAHGAVCADDGDDEHMRAVTSALRSSIRSAKIKATKTEKRRQREKEKA